MGKSNFKDRAACDRTVSLKTLPEDARPREKILARGEAALSDAELLAIVLRTGLPGQGVLALAQSLLDGQGGLRGLLQAESAALAKVKGLGPAKRAEILAVLGLARRAMAQQLTEQPVFSEPRLLRQYVQLQIGALPYECFGIVFLDGHQRLIGWEQLFRGTLSQTTVYPREVAVRALARNASTVIAVHNHPTGDLLASEADRALSRKLEAALALLDVRLADHLICGPQGCASMQETGGW